MEIGRVARRAATLAVVTTVILSTVWSSAQGVGSAAASTAHARIVLDEPSPDTVYEDNPTHLTGRLSNGKADKQVVIQRLVDGVWKQVGATRTDPKGEFGLDYRPVNPGPAALRAMHPARHHQVVSAQQPLEVLDRRVFLATKPSYNTFDDVVVSGTTRPRGASRRIVIQHLVSGRWLPVRSGSTDATGRYAIAMPNNLPGYWTVRAFWPGPRPNDGTAEYSTAHRYAVRAVLDPVVTRVTRAQLGGSFHDGCPVGPALLRNLALTYRTFGATVGRGTLVVRSTIVDDMVGVFSSALAHGYPIRRMFPTARYGGSDIQSMLHDNTSAFNCRHVTGDPTRLSPHSYGTAIDIDTVENPYQDIHGRWWPRNKGAQYRDRSHPYPGMLYSRSGVTQGMTSRGFQWGGVWSHPDYQHFDTGSSKQEEISAAQRAGSLSARSLPGPRLLGSGWRPDATAADIETGAARSGSFVRARDGREAARGVLPLGCQAHPDIRLPVPRFALQGSYLSAQGAPGQAVVMQFRSAREGSRYFAGLVSSLRACALPDGPSGLRIRVRGTTASSYHGTRIYSGSEHWSERDLRRGTRVMVVLRRQPPA